MQENNWNNRIDVQDDSEFNIKQQFERYLTNWKWFILSVLI